MRRLTCFLLALVMIVSLFPGVPHAHAAEAPSLVITNAEGEETDTFVVGEPIYVTANSTAGDWVGFYSEGSADGSSYWFWYYVDYANYTSASHPGMSWTWENGETYNIYDTVCYKYEYEGDVLPAGKYEIRLENNTSVTKTITLVEPESTESALAIQEEDVTAGEPFQVTATSYNDYAWVGLYSGTHNGPVSPSMDYYYTNGHNGLPMEFTVFSEGEYTLILYTDYNGTTVDKIVHFTAKAPEVELPPILTTDKTTYAYGEAINVTVDASAYASTGTDWVGIFDKGAVPGATVNSYFWYYPAAMGATFNVLNGTTNSLGNCVPGEYSIILLANDGYGVITSVDITITEKAEVSRTVVEPTCDEEGYTLVTYTDGSTEKVDIVAALGHDYGDWTYNAESKTHSKACKRDENHVATENCTFDEGAVTKEPTETETGVKTFTCTVCSGTYTEEIPATGAVETGRETVAPTCTEDGYTLITYSDGTTEKVDIVPALGHDIEGVAWTHVEGTKTHAKLCKREGCGVAAETADCAFTDTVADGVKTSTCTGCGYSFETALILYTDKTEYALGEPIMVTVNNQAYSATAKDWVGIWEADCATDANISIYYYYPADQGQTLNIYNAAYHQRDHIAQGGYEIRLFANDGYDMITSVKITVGPAVIDESKTKVVAPTCEEDGYTVYTYTDGTTQTVVDEGSALGHAYGDWTCNNDGKSHSKVCANDASHVITENCTWDEGVVTKEPSTEESGVRTYTCSVCEGTKEEIIPALTVEEVKRETVAPTCTEDGYTLVTYSDGTTQKTDIVPALGHDWGDWTHVERTRTHTHQCKREDCGVTETEDCVLEYEGLRGSQVECNCRTCGDYFEDLFWTDKAEYESGEDIIVTANPNYDFGSTDWIGLYKAGEVPNNSKNPTSIRWNYVGDFMDEDGMSIFLSSNHDRPEEDVDNRLTAGEYWLYLCKNNGWDVISKITFTVTAVETSRETTPPTCEEDGYVTAYYSDGTSKVVVTAEEDPSLKAIGHAYGEWVYDADAKQHAKTCANDETHVVTEACTFDEGTVTKEPTATEKGEKTFECAVCHGTYVQELAATGAELVEEKITKEPTCTEEGVKTAYYSDGSTIETPVPALGHSFEGAQWTYNSEDKTHTRECVRDCGHTETEACDMVLNEEKGVFECGTCGGSYVAFILNTDKTEYKFGESIYVTVNPDAYAASEKDWVGLYKKGEQQDPDNGGAFSIYWYYISELGNQVDINGRTNPAVRNENGRDSEFVPGEYSVVLLANDGYSVIASVDITITEEEIDLSGNTYGLEVNGEAVEDGGNLTFTMGDEIVLRPVVDGMVGSGWMGVYIAGYSRDHDFSTTPSDWYGWFYEYNGTEINLADKIGLEAGHYTVVLFGDGGYSKVQYLMNFEIKQSYDAYEVIKEPTCTTHGSARVKYVGAEDYTFEPIPALGHDWSFNAETKAHVCQREACGISEPCEFSTVTDEEGNVTHTCSVCHGTYTEEKEPDDEEEETEGALLRLAGANRVLTSLQAADMLMKELNVEKLDAVILASAMNFPDALSGSYLAAVKNAPILLTAKGYEETVNAFITENLAEGGTVYVLGGEAAVPAALLEGLTGVQRVAGETRFETNLEILKEAGITGNEILVCTALNFPDSLSAAAVGKPILLVGSKLTAEQEAYLQLLGEKNFYIIGGTSAISKSVEYALQSYGGTIRIAGENRYDTSALIAQRFFPEAEAVVLAYGRNYPDGLCGGALAAAMGAPVILVEDAFIDHAVDYVQGKEIHSGYVLGGTGLLSDASVRTIWDLAEDAEIAVYSK